MSNADPITQERFARLIERQRELESYATAEGARRYHTNLQRALGRGEAAHTGANKKLLSESVSALEAGIVTWLADSKERRGPKHSAIRWVELVGPGTAAYITVKVVLDQLSLKISLRDAALDISRLLLDELRFRRFKEQAPGLFEYRMASFSTNDYRHMARSMSATMAYADVDTSDLDMPDKTRLLVGVKLIDLLVHTTGIVACVSSAVVRNGPRKAFRHELKLVPTPETLEWLDQRNAALSLLSPINLPMVVPPLAWEPKQRGGYRFGLRGRYPMVRSWAQQHKRNVAGADMPLVYETLNRLQETPWRINRDVLELLRLIRLSGRSMAGVPSAEKEALPPKPLRIDDDEAVRRAYRREKHAWHERENERKRRGIDYSHTVGVAEQFADDGAVFFPYSLDFRGRIYPIASALSPQGDDLSKALLMFAEGKELGADGAYWLAVHGANLLDTTPQGEKIGKASLQDRVWWIGDHSVDICAVAADPLSNPWWADADKPLQFYAFCREWARYVESGSSEQFVSTLPVYMDGSCNGLQHFSAMFRDPVGGTAVNLIPSPVPQDIYQRIADAVNDELEQLAATNPLAAKWLGSGLVNRKLTKRPTMTFGYGSKKYGFQDQLIDELRGRKDWPAVRDLFTDPQGTTELQEACALMAKLIWDALGSIVVAASQGMAWMQKAVTEVVATGKPVEWVVPATGFPVQQRYFEHEKKTIRTILAGKVVQPTYYEPTTKIVPQKQRNAIAPNVVHSLDAAALMLTVHHAAQAGVSHFGMVHDSYGTLAGDVGTLAGITREAFISLYTEHDVVGSLYSQWVAQAKAPEKCPPPPPVGDLDLGVVRDSLYFFA